MASILTLLIIIIADDQALQQTAIIQTQVILEFLFAPRRIVLGSIPN